MMTFFISVIVFVICLCLMISEIDRSFAKREMTEELKRQAAEIARIFREVYQAGIDVEQEFRNFDGAFGGIDAETAARNLSAMAKAETAVPEMDENDLLSWWDQCEEFLNEETGDLKND